MSNISNGDVMIDTGLNVFHPKKFNVDDTFHYFASCMEPPIKRHSLNPEAILLKREEKLVEQYAVNLALLEYNKGPFARIGSENMLKTTRFLMRENENGSAAELEAFGSKAYDAVVTVWEGRGSYLDSIDDDDPGMDDYGWKRIWLPADHPSKLRYRFTRIELYPHTENWIGGNRLAEKFAAVRGRVDETKLHMFAVKVGLKSSQGSMRQMAIQVRDADNYITASRTYEMVHALLKKEYNGEKDLAVHGNKFYQLNDKFTRTLQGLNFVAGANLAMRINANNTPVLIEGLCTKLFFPKACVARFIDDYYGLPESSRLESYHEKLTKALRGKFVSIRTSHDVDERAIYLISKETPPMTDEKQQHYAWRSKPNVQLEYPTLPCLNVGTPNNHILIPPEMCVLKSIQSFKGGHTFGLERDLATTRKEMEAQRLIPEGAHIDLRDTLYVTRVQPVDASDLDRQLQEAFRTGPRILFVEAGLNKSTAATWNDFRKALVNSEILVKNEMKPENSQPLFLQYRPGNDPTAIWKVQLEKFVHAHKAAEKKTTLVVSLHADQYEKHIYKIIKYLCDCKVGVQTYFVNLATVQTKVRKFGKKGSTKAANEVVSRMRMRNPIPIAPAPSSGAKDIAVAFHVGCITPEVPKMATDGSVDTKPEPRYLVTFSTRHMDESKYYHTRVFLKGPREMLTYDPTEDLSTVLGRLLPRGNREGPHKVTILRTGFMPPRQRLQQPLATDSSSPGRTLAVRENSEFVNTVNYRLACDEASEYIPVSEGSPTAYNTKEHVNPEANGKSSDESKADLANREFKLVRDLIRTSYNRNSKLAYILLTEDHDLTLSQQAKSQIERAISFHAPEGSLKSSLFLADTQLQTNSKSVTAHRKVMVKSDSKLVTLTLLGDCLSDEPQQLPVGWEPRKSSSRAGSTTGRQGSTGGHDQQVGSSPSRQKFMPQTEEQSAGVRKRSSGSMHSGVAYDPGSPESPFSPEKNALARRSSTMTVGTNASTSTVRPQNPKQTSAMPANPYGATQYSAKQPKPSEVTYNELKRLADLWCDRHLGLYDTKWPIPTHLAYLATKRAQFHLRYDKWDSDDDDAAPCYLEEVDPEVQKTLYFL